MKKATMTTVKAFIRKAGDSLMIMNITAFDSMTDCVSGCGSREFRNAECDGNAVDGPTKGINGAWFVGSGRDYVSPFFEGGKSGFEISNCCGRFVLAVTA